MTRDKMLRAWVDALESGQYKQTNGGLHRENSYCCLGVLCDVSKIGQWESRLDDDGVYAYVTENERRGAYLPSEIRVSIGIQRVQEGDLAQANDDGETFAQIAQRIRKMFPDVFPVAA